MKIDTFKSLKILLENLSSLSKVFSTAVDYHLNLDVNIQFEYTGFVKTFVFDKEFQDNGVLDSFNGLIRFIENHYDEIVTVRFKSDFVLFD